MADQKNIWFEISRRSLNASGIFQVGQILTDPLNPESALFRNGLFKGTKPDTLSRIIQSRSPLVVDYDEMGKIEIGHHYSSAIDGARVDGKGNFVRWQWLQTESITRADKFLKAVIQEDEVKRYLSSGSCCKDLFLVTEIVKVQEIIPERTAYNLDSFQNRRISSPYSHSPSAPFPVNPGVIQEPGAPFSAYNNASTAQRGNNQNNLYADFQGHKNGKPFIWKYGLEQLTNLEKADLVSAKRYYPGEALSSKISSATNQNWIEILLGFLFGWMLYMPFRFDKKGEESLGRNVMKGSEEMPTRPKTLSWSRVIDDPITTNDEASSTSVHDARSHLNLQPQPHFPQSRLCHRLQEPQRMRDGTDYDEYPSISVRYLPTSQSDRHYDVQSTVASREFEGKSENKAVSRSADVREKVSTDMSVEDISSTTSSVASESVAADEDCVFDSEAGQLATCLSESAE